MKLLAWLLLALTTFGGALCLYSVSFSYWMMADPLYDSPAWHTHFDHMLGVTVLDASIWVASIVWLVRRNRAQPI